MRPGAAGAYAPPRHKGVGEYEPYIDCDRRFGLGGVRRVGVQFAKERAISSGLRLIGSVLLLVVAASHFAEKFRWLAWMGWGLPNSPGHYVDLVSAIVGVSLFSGARFVLRFGGSADILRSPPRSSL